MKKKFKASINSILSIIFIGTIFFITWSQFTYKPTKEALLLVEQKDKENLIYGE